MNYLKKLGMCLIYTIITLLIGILLITILNYFSLFSIKLVNIFKILILILSILIGSFKLGITSNKKGYLEGIKYGMILSFVLLILNLIFYHSFEMKNFLLYLIIIICSCLGSMIGIARHKDVAKT